MSTVTTTYMNLTLPVPSSELGPAWAVELNAAIASGIDGHDHSSGKGVQITPAGMNISSDLAFGSNNATALRSTRFSSQGAALAGVSDLRCLYAVGTDLWYNDGSGNQIQLTSGGTLNSAALINTTWPTQAVSTNISIAAGSTKIAFLVDTSGLRTITLPLSTAVAPGRFFVFKDASGFSDALPITIAPSGSDTIEGVAASIALSAIRGEWIFVTDGAGAWHVMRSGAELNGATVPSAGALTTGNTLQVTGSRKLGYGPLWLAGGLDYVFGVLPANQLGVATVSQSGAVQLTRDWGGTATAPTVIGVTATSANPFVLGSAGPSSIQLGTGATTDVFWARGSSAPTLGVQAQNASGAPPTWLLYGSDHDPATTGRGGHVILQTGASHGASGGDTNVMGQLSVRIGGAGGNILMQIGEVATGRAVIALGNSASSSDIVNGNRLVWLANANTVPTTASANGAILYASGGDLGVLSPTYALAVSGGNLALTAQNEIALVSNASGTSRTVGMTNVNGEVMTLGVKPSTGNKPASNGDLVTWIPNATTAPSSIGTVNGGVLMYANSGRFGVSALFGIFESDFDSSLSATAGGAGALPATPTGYLIAKRNGATIKIPYYNS